MPRQTKDLQDLATGDVKCLCFEDEAKSFNCHNQCDQKKLSKHSAQRRRTPRR